MQCWYFQPLICKEFKQVSCESPFRGGRDKRVFRVTSVQRFDKNRCVLYGFFAWGNHDGHNRKADDFTKYFFVNLTVYSNLIEGEWFLQ